MFARILRAIVVAILGLIFRITDTYARARVQSLRNKLARDCVRDCSRDYVIYETCAIAVLGFYSRDRARDVTDTYNSLVRLGRLSARSLREALPGCARIRARLRAPFDDVVVHIALANATQGEDSAITLEFGAR